MRVVSWNLQHGVPDPLGRSALARAVIPLVTLGADVYGFQELDRSRWRTRFEHQGALLAAALDGELVWARAKRWLWGAQANALVVRGEVDAREVLLLPGAGERRVAVLAHVTMDGTPWSLANCARIVTNRLGFDERRQSKATRPNHPDRKGVCPLRFRSAATTMCEL